MPRAARLAALAVLPHFLVACSGPDGGPEGEAAAADTAAPHVTAASPVEAGAYLVHVAGCNDCHTAGYLERGGRVPESEWLKGSPVGFRGPWGTTWAGNLRRTVERVSEDGWVEMMRTRDRKPPMPWFNVHAMSERDLRAMYRYIGTLGPAGDSVPAALPPGERPSRHPYYEFVPKTPGEGG